MKKYIFSILTIIFVFLTISNICCASESAIAYHTNMKPTEQRPRVFFNSDEIPEILENAQKSQNIAQWNRFLEYALNDMPNDLKTASVFDAEAVRYIESKAFYCVLYSDDSRGREAIDDLKSVLDGNKGIWYDYNSAGEAIYLVGVVYDWCWHLLSETEKTYFQNMFISLAKESDVGWPPSVGSTLMSHAAESNIMRDMLAAAIAMYGDNDEIYQNVMGRFFSEFVDERKFMYESGYFFPGLHYFSYRFQWEIISAKLIDSAYGIKNIYGDKQKDMAYMPLYFRRPDGSFLRSGDNAFNNHYVGSNYYANLRSVLYTASYYDDPYLNFEAQKILGVYKFNQSNVNQTVTPVEFLIMSEPDAKQKNISALPLTKFFSSPYGAMVARTSWDEGMNSNAVVAEMKVVENQFNEHQHLDAGAFQIYYKGALANDTGYYQAAYSSANGRDTKNDGNTVYAGAHDNNYQSRTIAHNCMLVYDPNEIFKPKQTLTPSYKIENDGGQHRKNNSSAPLSLTSYNLSPAKWRSGRVLGAEFGEDSIAPEWSYLKGDISYAYSDKVKGYERSFMFLNLKSDEVPAAMIVFDRVESSSEYFRKTWLLHTKNEPEISSGKITAEVTENGYNGRLTLDPLLPKKDNLDINVVSGGEGDAFVNGTNYYATVYPGRMNEGGGSRIELSPKTDNKEDFFLNVIQVGDADSDVSHKVSLVETDTHAGAVISDRVVLFTKQKDRIVDSISFEFSSDLECLITVADCKEGKWNIYDKYGLYDVVTVSKSGGVASFYGRGGSYTMTRTGDLLSEVSNVGFDPDSNSVDYIASRSFDGSTNLGIQTSHFTHKLKSEVPFKAPDDVVYELTPVTSGSGNFIHNVNRSSNDYGYIKASSIETEFMLTDKYSRLGLSLCAYSEDSSGELKKENWLYNLISVSANGFYVLNSNAINGISVFDTSVIPVNGRLKIADSVSEGKWHKLRIVFSADGGYMDFYFDSYSKVRVPISKGSALRNGLKLFSLTEKSDSSGNYASVYFDNVSYVSAFMASGNSYFEIIENAPFEPLYALSDLYTYYTSGSQCVLTGIKEDSGAKEMTCLVVEDNIGEYTLCGIADGAFKDCAELSELVILAELNYAGAAIASGPLSIKCSPKTREILSANSDFDHKFDTTVYRENNTVYPLSDGIVAYKVKYNGNTLLSVEADRTEKFKPYELNRDGSKYYFWGENLRPVVKPIN